MIGIYFFLKLMLFFALVKALVKSETLGEHPLFFGILYTGLVAFLSYVFVLTTNPNAFNAAWVLRAAGRRISHPGWSGLPRRSCSRRSTSSS